MLARTRAMMSPGLGPLIAARVWASIRPVGLRPLRYCIRADRVVERLVVGRVVRPAAHVQLLAQQRDARVLHAVFQDRAVGDALGLRFDRGVAAAQLGELLLERAEALVRRIVALDRGVDVGGSRELLEHLVRIGRVVAVFDIGGDARRRDAADGEMAHVGQHRFGELQVAGGERLGAVDGAEFRHRIIGGVEAVVGGVLQLRDGGLGLRGQAAVMDPQRRIAARGVDGFDGAAVGRARDALVELLRRDEVS